MQAMISPDDQRSSTTWSEIEYVSKSKLHYGRIGKNSALKIVYLHHLCFAKKK